jgi:nucleotide-binding universal stress UspA family protein
MKGIIVGMDGSAGAQDALRWAAREGRIRGLPVAAVLAWGMLDQHHPDHGTRFDPAYDAEHARVALQTWVGETLGEEEVALHVVCDLPARALVAVSDGADLLVVGGRGLGGFRGLLLGSVSHQVLHHAACPVAVVRHEDGATGDRPPRVLVGVDGSDTAQLALRWAAEEARLRGAELRVVHAWHLTALGGDPYAPTYLDPQPFEDAGATVLEHAVAALRADDDAPTVVPVLVRDHPANALLDEARSADLVVLGARGAGGFAGLLVGSTSTQVVHHAPCPVVVLPEAR